MMRKVKSHWSAGNVYLSSSSPASMEQAYHKILGAVKRNAMTATSWGRGDGYDGRTVEGWLQMHFAS
jgi:hypothetical protein